MHCKFCGGTLYGTKEGNLLCYDCNSEFDSYGFFIGDIKEG